MSFPPPPPPRPPQKSHTSHQDVPAPPPAIRRENRGVAPSDSPAFPPPPHMNPPTEALGSISLAQSNTLPPPPHQQQTSPPPEGMPKPLSPPHMTPAGPMAHPHAFHAMPAPPPPQQHPSPSPTGAAPYPHTAHPPPAHPPHHHHQHVGHPPPPPPAHHAMGPPPTAAPHSYPTPAPSQHIGHPPPRPPAPTQSSNAPPSPSQHIGHPPPVPTHSFTAAPTPTQYVGPPPGPRHAFNAPPWPPPTHGGPPPPPPPPHPFNASVPPPVAPSQHLGHSQTRHMTPPPPPMNGMPQNGMAPQQQQPKIDPNQIPRPPLFTRPQDGEAVPIYYPAQSLKLAQVSPPPPADSRFVTFDDGNAAPQLIRSTVYAIPMDRATVRHTLDMGLLCTPLAIASEDYVPRPRILPDGSEDDEWRDAQRIPLIRVSSSPPRCPRCHAYVNPFWTSKGCNFCGHGYKPQQSSAFTTQYGTVEYEVGGPYVTRSTPVQPVYLYALDATCPNLPSYMSMIQELGRSMEEHHRQQMGEAGLPPPRIGVCLVGSFGVVVAYLDDKNSKVALSVMSDVTEEPFSPLPLDQWTHDLSTEQGLEQWEAFMGKLWDAWLPFLNLLEGNSPYGTRAYELSCGGAALGFMSDALSESGGRATLITWRRPNFGIGSIRDREKHNTSKYTKEKTEHSLYTPLQLQNDLADKSDKAAATFYKQLGESSAKNRVCFDVIFHTRPTPMAFLDLATMGELCRITSGRLKWIRSREWKEPLLEELRRPALSFVGRDAVFKMRCSNGLQVKSYMSCTAPGVAIENALADSPELEMSIVDPQSSIAVTLDHRVGGISKDSRVVYFQSALLYTALDGKRRVRVSTLGLRTSSRASEVYASADFGTVAALLTRQTISSILEAPADSEGPISHARNDLTSKCAHILSNYRLHTSALSVSAGQLVVPERLKLLPLFCLGALKSAMFRYSLPKRGSGVRAVKPNPTADERAFAMCIGSSVVPAMAMLLVHPNVFPILDLQNGNGEWVIPKVSISSSELEKAASHAYIQLPETVNPSITSLEDEGIYLVDDGLSLFVYLGKAVPSDVMEKLLVKDDDGLLISKDSDYGKQVHRVLWQLRTYSSVGEGSESTLRPVVAPVEVVVGDENHRDPLEERLMSLMVDDSSGTGRDYIDFVVNLHKRVKGLVQKG